MNKINKEYGLKRRAKVFIGICISILIIILFSLFFVIKNQIEEQTYNSIKESVLNINRRTSLVIEDELLSKQDILELIAIEIGNRNDENIPEILENLDRFVSQYGFYNMGVILPDGTCYNTLGEVLDLSPYEYVDKGFQGESVITEGYQAELEQKSLNIFVVPVYRDGEVECLLSACYEAEGFVELLNINSRVDDAQSIVLNSKGKLITDFGEYTQKEYRELADSIEKDDSIIPSSEMRDNSYFDIKHNGKEYIACMSKMNVNDWYCVSILLKNNYFKNIYSFERYLMILIVVLLMGIAAGFILLIYSQQRHRIKISESVFIDSVTRKENYSYLETTFEKRKDKEYLYVAALDIDAFKAVNVAYGSEESDKVLRYIGNTFEEEFPMDEIYREHSDYFVAIIHADSEDEVTRKVKKYLQRIKSDISYTRVIPFSISMGICKVEKGSSLHTAYTNAVIAKETVKVSTTEKYAFFNSNLKNVQLKNLEMNSSFASAVDNNEFQVFYQPKYDMRTKEVIGSEALVRWIKPNQEIVSPGDFIPCFEKNGKITALDEVMIEMVCREMKEMERKGLPIKRVSVNLSRLHLKKPKHIVRKISNLIKEYNVDPSKLSFEITESAVYDDSEAADYIVESLHRQGCQVDMDDYGTGMSGLQVLAKTKFDTVKLDGSFISNINNQKTEIIIRSTIDMISDLGMELIVEGVETQEQVDFLVSNQCYFAQGYFYSRPLPRANYEEILMNIKE